MGAPATPSDFDLPSRAHRGAPEGPRPRPPTPHGLPRRLSARQSSPANSSCRLLSHGAQHHRAHVGRMGHTPAGQSRDGALMLGLGHSSPWDHSSGLASALSHAPREQSPAGGESDRLLTKPRGHTRNSGEGNRSHFTPPGLTPDGRRFPSRWGAAQQTMNTGSQGLRPGAS